MSANANGTPTSLGIPTLAVTDPLTKDGINEITSSVDSKVSGRMFAPSAPSDKQVVKWSQAGSAWVAGNVQPSELGQEAATNNQALVWNTGSGKWVPTTVVKGTAGAVPSNPTVITNDGVTRMAGLGSSCAITPVSTGTVIVFMVGSSWTGNLTNQTAALRIAYGTGTAPANAAAQTGTQVGAAYPANSGGLNQPYTLMGRITGLTLNTAVWFDLQVTVTNGAGGASSAPVNVGFVAYEVG